MANDNVVTDTIEQLQKPEKLQVEDTSRQRSIEEISSLIRARYPLIWIVSFEEQRVLKALRDCRGVRDRGKKLLHWSITDGWQGIGSQESGKEITDPYKALNYILATETKAVYVLKDFHPYLQNPTIVRRLRDMPERLRGTGKTCILLSAVLKVPPELEKEIAVVDFDLPDLEELAFIRDGVLASVADDPSVETNLEPRQLEKIAEAALGLTAVEAENVFAKSIVKHKRFDIDVILQEKEQIIRKSGLLEFLHPQETLEGVGGLTQLKSWLDKRTKAFTREAREFGLPQPKGILLLGVPGCGKSLSAKSIGNLWQLPLLRLDVGRVFGSLVGSSEENIRRALRTAEAVAPCILWLDELEKGLSGVQSSGQSDAGTTARVFGTFITWLQEKTSPVFVIATANQVKMLPPELLRKGRFDEIFFVDLPSAEERREIIQIHIRRASTPTHPRDPADFDLDALVEASEGYSGAEIEEAVKSALYDAFDQGMDLNTELLLQALDDTVPLSTTMQEDITGMREWAKTRARFASAQTLREERKVRKLEL
ncbi:MAG: AAA family ATPase [Planctomycetota bacterium]|nr:MAG: AAA family ATPase [Planctomycetota bacterium]